MAVTMEAPVDIAKYTIESGTFDKIYHRFRVVNYRNSVFSKTTMIFNKQTYLKKGSYYIAIYDI